jgi:uncharacterized protein YicC (UPF0701 family)
MSERIVSMTGFGRAATALDGRMVHVEIRSLNHRGLDIKVRAHDVRLSPEVETEVLRQIRGRLVRGSIAVTLSEEGGQDGETGIDIERVRRLHGMLEQVRRDLGLPSPVDLGVVGAFLAGGRGGSSWEVQPGHWPALADAVGKALDGLCGMRAREGRAMVEDLQGRLANLRRLVERIAELASDIPSRAGRRLEERIATLGNGTTPADPVRLAQEVAILAERLDVSEELARLRAHLDHLAELLMGQGEAAPGRRLDFLAQEIGRELNTLGGKIQDATVAVLVIDGKAELEKLREQAQNIE